MVAGVGASPATAGVDTGEVMLRDVGPGFELVAEVPGTLGALTRTWESADAQLDLHGFPVTDPPGVRTLFSAFASPAAGLGVVPEPSLELGTWLTVPDRQPGEGGLTALVFAGRDYLFSATLLAPAMAPEESVAFVLALAGRQIDAAGGSPAAAGSDDEPTEGEREVAAWLPANPPAGFELGLTVVGKDELPDVGPVNSEVVEFLDQRSSTAARVWSSVSGELVGAVSITRYPYDIFAAAFLGEFADAQRGGAIPDDAFTIPDVLSFVDETGQTGTAFRRGDVFVIVATQREPGVPAERASALAVELTELAAAQLPAGGTGAYHFPSPPSKLAGLLLTAGIVTAAAGGSALVARLRARRLRRQWSAGAVAAPIELPPPGSVVELDASARRLRRHGGVVFGAQLVSINVGVVALAGDFAWRGAAVAAVSFVAGLAFTRLWQRRELGLLGPQAPPRALVLPRPLGALVGIIALALIGFGGSFALKGLRYLVLPPTLAQLRWSDLLGLAPRTVGVVFGVGGFLVAVAGGLLFRSARSLARANAKRVLEADPRPAALYLRSFGDDELPLPVIASARRPLVELFSPRGADPFEESVAWELYTYGPVVAVGRPGRSLASLGAAREHLADDSWRQHVAQRMDDAVVIAVATGETEGLAWELGEVVRGGHLDKTMFVFPPVSPDALERRWDFAASSLAGAGVQPAPLPAPCGLVHTVQVGPDGAVRVTTATRRDEATYRTAVDVALSAGQWIPVPAPLDRPPAHA